MDSSSRNEAKVQDLKRRRPSRRWPRPGGPNEIQRKTSRSTAVPFVASEPGAPLGQRQAAWLDGLRPWARSIGQRCGVSRSDVDDVVQDAYLVVINKWADFVPRSDEPEEALRRKWIAAIVCKVAASARARDSGKRGRFEPFEEQHSSLPSLHFPSPEQHTSNKQLVEVLLRTERPESLRLFFSHKVATNPARDISRDTGTALGTIYSRVRTALRRMRVVLKAHDHVFRPLRSR